MPNPFLDAVSSCFVEWLIFSYVIADFVVRKFFESNFGDAVFSNLLFISGKAYGSNHLVGLARERMQHCKGIGSVFRFAQGFALVPYDGIGSEEHAVRRYFSCKRCGF